MRREESMEEVSWVLSGFGILFFGEGGGVLEGFVKRIF